MIDRLEILAKVDEIEDTHCIECPVSSTDRPLKCLSCPYGKKMEKLGRKLMKPSEEKKNKIIAKGDKMTIDDVRFLISKGMTRQEVGRAIGITSNVGITRFFREVLGEMNGNNKNGSPQAEREKRIMLADKIIRENNHLKTGELADMVKKETGYTKGTSLRKIYEYRKELRS